MRHKKILIGILIVTILLTLMGCEEKQDDGISKLESLPEDKNEDEDINIDIDYEPVYGGELVFPLTTIGTLNPLISENKSYYHFSKLIFESLFELDDDLNVKNQLVEDYTIEDEGKLIKIKLRDDVLWHDNIGLSSYDVAFTIETIQYGDENIVYKEIFDNILGMNSRLEFNRTMDIEIVDDYNFNIIFDESFSNGLEILTFPIIPKHKFVSELGEESAYIKALEEEYIPIGTGPYKFASYEKYKMLKLEANPLYRDGKAYIDKIKGRILDNSEMALMAFDLGDIDLTVTEEVDWEKYDQSIYEFVSQNYEFLGFNFSQELFNSDESRVLRKAINYGIDRQEIIKRVYLGHGTQVDLPVHPNSWLYLEEVNMYGYNPAKARDEIEKMGWKDINGNGFYEDENGEEVVLKLITNSYNPLRLKAADMIASDLHKIGINIVKDYSEYIPDRISEEMIDRQWEEMNSRIENGDYDIALLGWNLPGVADLNFAFHSSKIESGSNLIGYNNENMDNRLLKVFNATTRENKIKAYSHLQKLIVEELPYISLYFKNNALLVDEKVRGDISPNFNNVYRNIEKWYIPKEFQKNS